VWSDWQGGQAASHRSRHIQMAAGQRH
jgi:hypothetical protein